MRLLPGIDISIWVKNLIINTNEEMKKHIYIHTYVRNCNENWSLILLLLKRQNLYIKATEKYNKKTNEKDR